MARSSFLAYLSAATLTVAGELEFAESLSSEPQSQGNFWADLAEGQLYKNKDNPWISSVKVEGRAHYQAAWVDGNDTDGNGFSGDFEEFRRFRVGTEIDFLTAFEVSVGVNLVDDERYEDGDLSMGVEDYANAYLRLSVDKLFDLLFLDELEFTYGRQKVRVGYEAHRSSNELITVERSALSNRIRGEGSRRTGFLLGAEKDDFTLNLGVFSHDRSDFVGSWNHGHFYYGSLQWDLSKQWTLLIDGIINEGQGPDEALGYDWVTSLSVLYEKKRFGMSFNLAMGDNGDARNQVFDEDRQGAFYGAVFTPWCWILEDRLQLVGQAQYQISDESEGIRLADRYLIPFHDAGTAEVNNGRGDEHFSAYLGLNFHPWKGESRVMVGVQYDDLQTPDGNLDAITTFLAFRTSF
ncbi:porin [Roseibacillus persicicus]|uniref:Uncharacterized protein n=1 Tax=Roseibacillus persicicus TaxID=454148 RepID=A0A918WN65_9BACT|nr:porin [Roseibacillus persicicus]GHC61754.1 hypothetical protein GCM10007100_31470 [Roseibacillus persicicus]